MGFISELIQKNNNIKEAKYKAECSSSIASLENFIPWTKEVIKKTMSKKDLTLKDSNEIKWYVNVLDGHYGRFLDDLKEMEFMYSCKLPKGEKESLKQKIDYMYSLKKQYRKEFESIYNGFEHLSKGKKIPNRNSILNLMRKAFDFDSTKYNTRDDQLQSLVTKK